VSLLWPNRLEVLLAAQGATTAGLSVASSLDALLGAMQVKPNTQLTVVLSADFVRYQLLPAQQIAMSATEKLAYAAAAFKEVYGAETNAWKIKLHDTGFKLASIAAAVDEIFLDNLQQVSQQHKTKLVSVQPHLMGAYNSCKIKLSKFDGYFVVVETAKILLLNMQAGQCKNLRTSAIGHDWQQDLKQLLAREAMLNDETGHDVLLHAPMHKSTIKIEGWQVNRVGAMHMQPAADRHSAMLGTSI
jgi:hypothetical protein